jgi:hypothetical protein
MKVKCHISCTFELKNKYRPRVFRFPMNHSPHTYKVFKYDPGKAGEVIVKWELWDHPTKSKAMDFPPLFTKVEGLNKDQKALLERAIDKFILDNKMCPKKFNNPSNQKNKSITSGLERKNNDPQVKRKNWRILNAHGSQMRKMYGPQIKRKIIDSKRSTIKAMQPKEPVENDEDGFILVTKKNAARRIPPIQQQLQQLARNEMPSSDEDNDE